MMSKKKTFLIINAFLIFLSNSCKKEFDTPTYKPANDGAKLIISQLKSRLLNSDSYFRFGVGDTNLYCTVVADESSGNIFKQLFVVDDAGSGIQLKLMEPGGLFVGDRIRINLNNLYLVNSSNMIYLDSVNIVKSVVKLSSGHKVTPKLATISSITKYANQPTHPSCLQSQLVEINQVEFVVEDRSKTFGDAVGKNTVERHITDCQSNQVIVRTSGFANFAGKQIPGGSGKIIAIVSQYGDDMQLIIRNYNEIQMTGNPCTSTGTYTGTAYLNKNFNDNRINSGGWTNMNVSGNTNWTTSTFGGQSYGKISNYAGGANSVCETWLISPGIDLSGSSNPILTFQNAFKFTGPALEVFVSINYTSGNPSSATWTKLSFTLSGGEYVFVNSGNISLSNYKANNVHIAFKYSGTSTSGSTWELDDILVREF